MKKIVTNKTMKSLIALILMIAMVVSIFAVLPITNAHTPPWTFSTNAYVGCAPSPIGLGQYTTIVMWVDRYSPTAGGGAGQRWDGFKLEITKPDGAKETLGPWKAVSDVGSHYVQYTPDQVGTYSIVFSWPGETAVAMPGLPSTSSNIGDYYAGSTSAPVQLVVQQESITDWQEPPLPTGYWTTPINAANRGWSTLASNWLDGSWLVNNFQMWGTAPESAHILWSRPITPARAGGINDASWPGISSNVRDYESPFPAPIIMNGVVYYNAPPVSDSSKYGYYAMDLYTGEQIWYKNGTDNGLNNKFDITSGYSLEQAIMGVTGRNGGDGGIDWGWLYHYNSVNGQGILSYLISDYGNNWYFFDAATGNWMLTLTNVPGGTQVTDQDGSILRYSYNPTTGNLLCWNVSQSIPPGSPLGTTQQQWKMRFGATVDAVNDTSWTILGPTSTVPTTAIRPRSGYTMNITVQKNLPGSITILQDAKRVPKEIFGSYIATVASTSGSEVSADTFSAWLLRIDEHVAPYSPYPEFSATQNTNLGFGASLLWNKNITVPLTGKNYTWSIDGVSYDDQVFILNCKQTSQLWGYSLTTGALLWGPTAPPSSQMSFYGISSNMYYGKVISNSEYGGSIAAYDAQTGKVLWTYNATASGHEGAYGENMPLSITFVSDGKLYLHSTEHSPTKPLWRASYLRCINITDGTEIWKLLDFNNGASLADGYIVTGNEYDNQIYCIGKGPSATTVEAPMTGITVGDSVVISGTVTDQSPGAKGTPAIADDSMQAWMEYLYEQQAMPTNATGVTVTLDAVDPNGNFINIGTTTSDISSNFGYAWTPPDVPGKYTIIATFAGSKSYGSSYAETYAVVSVAPPTPTPTAIPLQSVTDMYFVPAIAGLIVAIAIVGAVILLAVRKRPTPTI